jgi:lysyl endopeptidase
MKFLLLVVLFTQIFSQIHLNEKPYSTTHHVLKQLPTVQLPHVDHQNFETQDLYEERFLKVPARFGAPIRVNITLSNSGAFQDVPEGRLWRLRIQTKGAFSTNMIFSRFALPIGAKLWIVSDNSSSHEYLGAFDYHNNNKRSGTFSTAPLEGDSFIIELFEPKEFLGMSELEISTIVHAYKNIFKQEPDSGTCNINVRCKSGDLWRSQIQSVAVIMTDSGSRFCTGAMINTVNRSGRQLFLTADHCGKDVSSWVLLFNFESSNCDGGTRSFNYSVSGLKELSRNSHTDFVLAEVEEEIPQTYRVFLSGFNAIEVPEEKISVGIHHPKGDIKKISFSEFPLTSSNWRSAEHQNTHWKIQKWTNGTTEPGSSGSPLFNARHQIIGQLTGGSASCFNPDGYDLYGKLSKSWEITRNPTERLKDHLDPSNIGKLADGMPLMRVTRDVVNQCRYACSFLTQKSACELQCK